MTVPAGLAVLDFSGTLSPGAASFAAPDGIADELRRSGLAELGFADPDDFWRVLVDPTWERGSTTRAGYVTVLTDAAVDHLRRRTTGTVDRDAVEAAVQRLAGRYLAASVIAPAWHGWLRRLVAMAGTAVVVATDHYAEATAWIIAQLEAADLAATALDDRGAATAADRRTVLVANSAEIGHHKQARPFWDAVAPAVGPVGRVAVVDDFGTAEAGADAYADPDRVARRREATVGLLAEVFAAEVTTIPCAPPDDGAAHAVIDRAGRDLVVALAGADR